MAKTPLSDDGLDLVFREAHTAYGWDGRTVSTALMQAVYDLTKWGPTSANCSPARFVFVHTPEGKARLAPHLAEGNRAKTLAAPVTVIVAHDLHFYEKIPQLLPHNPSAREWFSGNEALARETAFRNGSLQGAYLIIAARALGLDCGPMSGFNQVGVDAEFFPGGTVKSNFLCNIGYGSQDGFFPRSPRLSFEEACTLV